MASAVSRLFDEGGVSGGPAVPWWSFTKVLIAAAALRLAEQGALALDTPMDAGRFTLAQVLQHRAGLADYGGLAAYHDAVARGDEPWATARLLAEVDAERLIYEPGSGWAYSNIGYLFARQAVEAATGLGLDAALRKLVLDPLGAMSTRIVLTRADLAHVTMGAASAYHPGWVYHGLAAGPLSEAALVLRRLLDGGLLGASSLALMRDAHPLPQFAGPVWTAQAYGLGLMTPGAGGLHVAGHTGAGPGSSIAVYAAGTLQGVVAAAVWTASEDASAVERACLDVLRAEPAATASTG